MQNIHLDATVATPQIDFLFDQRHLTLAGESYPENAAAFYGPLTAAVRAFLAQAGTAPVTVDVRLAYFNSSSTKILLELFADFNRAALAGTPVTLNWHYDPEDDTILEFGQEIGDDCPALWLNTLELA